MDGREIVAFAEKEIAGAKISLLDTPADEVKSGVISWPGEYDIDGISVRGIGHEEGKRVSFVVDDSRVRIAFMAAPLHDWKNNELELLGNVDILCIPADNAKIVQKIIDEVDPRVLIPLPTADEETFVEILKAIGAHGKEIEPEYKLKGALPAEGREVVI